MLIHPLHHKPRMRNQEYSPALLILVSFCLTFFVTKFKETVRFKQLNCCQISSNGPEKKEENLCLNIWKSLESFPCLFFPLDTKLSQFYTTMD